jgi:hypothetical protein
MWYRVIGVDVFYAERLFLVPSAFGQRAIAPSSPVSAMPDWCRRASSMPERADQVSPRARIAPIGCSRLFYPIVSTGHLRLPSRLRTRRTTGTLQTSGNQTPPHCRSRLQGDCTSGALSQESLPDDRGIALELRLLLIASCLQFFRDVFDQLIQRFF